MSLFPRRTFSFRSLFVSALALFVLPVVVFAQEVLPFSPLTGLPGVDQVTGADSLSNFLNMVYRLCVGIAAVLAVIQITRAGMVYMLQDSFTEKKEARHLILMSLLGLVLVLAPTVVFGLIDPRILSLRIGFEGLQFRAASELDLNIDDETSSEEDNEHSNDESIEGEGCVNPDQLDLAQDRYANLEELGDGDAELGQSCCTDTFEGDIVSRGNPPTPQCDLGAPDEQPDRYVIRGTVHATIRRADNTQFQTTELRIATPGIGYGWFASVTVEDPNSARVYGFRTQNECDAVRNKSRSAFLTHIKTVTGVGELDAYFANASSYTNVDPNNIVSFEQITGLRCYKVSTDR